MLVLSQWNGIKMGTEEINLPNKALTIRDLVHKSVIKLQSESRKEMRFY